MKNRYTIILSLIVLLTLFTSCGSSSSSDNGKILCSGDILFPFQEKEDGDWGFIDHEGNEVISPEFKQRPSLAKNGIFLVRHTKKNKTYFQFYRISDNKAKEIGDRWDNAHMFSDGLAAVVQENKYIQFIDEDMKVAFTLNKIETAGNFQDGLVRVENNEGKWGFANKEGKIVIKAEYDEVSDFNDGNAVVSELKGKEDEEKTNHFYIIDKKGEVLLDLKDKYSYVQNATEGYFKVQETHDDEIEYGFIDIEGEKIIKPKDYESVTSVHNGHFSYLEEGEWGLKNMEGEKVFGAKYAEPLYVFNDIVWFKKEGEEDYGAINLEGEEVLEEEYDNPFPFICNTTFAKDGRDFIFIDQKGETINKNEYRNIFTDYGSFIHPMYSEDYTYTYQDINSDYFNVSSFTSMVNVGEFSKLLNKGVVSIQNYFASTDANKKALLDNSNGSHRSKGIGESNYYNGGYSSYMIYWNRSSLDFAWKKNKELSTESSGFQSLKVADKNINSIYVSAQFDDYLKTKVISKNRWNNLYREDYSFNWIKDLVRVNSKAKLNEITVTVYTQNKAYSKAHKIAEAFGNELKKLIDTKNDDFNEENDKNDNKYMLYGTSDKMSVRVSNDYNNSIIIKIRKIDQE